MNREQMIDQAVRLALPVYDKHWFFGEVRAYPFFYTPWVLGKVVEIRAHFQRLCEKS